MHPSLLRVNLDGFTVQGRFVLVFTNLLSRCYFHKLQGRYVKITHNNITSFALSLITEGIISYSQISIFGFIILIIFLLSFVQFFTHVLPFCFSVVYNDRATQKKSPPS